MVLPNALRCDKGSKCQTERKEDFFFPDDVPLQASLEFGVDDVGGTNFDETIA